MIYLPYAADLLGEAHRVLSRATASPEGVTDRYGRLMAMNAIAIAQREIGQAQDANQRLIDHLHRLTDTPTDRAAPSLHGDEQVTAILAMGKSLKHRIRNGYFDSGERREELVRALSGHARASLAISNPKAVRL
ncbi:MAG: DUF6285 domain-containing protein [Pseudomonadota bacterium]